MENCYLKKSIEFIFEKLFIKYYYDIIINIIRYIEFSCISKLQFWTKSRLEYTYSYN